MTASAATRKKVGELIQRALDEFAKTKGEDGKPPPPGYMHATFAKHIALEAFTNIEMLEKKLTDLQARSQRYRGVYQRAADYVRGDMVTRSGSLWCCVSERTTEVPGSSECWVLSVKSGALE